MGVFSQGYWQILDLRVYINAMNIVTSLLRVLPICSICFVLALPQVHADSDEDTPLTQTMKQSSNALKSLRKIDKDDEIYGQVSKEVCNIEKWIMIS